MGELWVYCWLIEGRIVYRIAPTRERAKDQLFEDGITDEWTYSSEVDFVGKFGTVESAIRAADEFLYGPLTTIETRKGT